MSEDMVKSIQKLLDSGKGDPARLTEILDTIKQKAPLYFSDYRYLEDLFAQKEESQIKTEEKSKSKKVKKEDKKEGKKQKHSSQKTSQALSILKTRLASGEISLDEFQALKKVIQES